LRFAIQREREGVAGKEEKKKVRRVWMNYDNDDDGKRAVR